MPTYVYWGDDAFRMDQAVKALHQKVLDATWETFNYDKIDATAGDAIANCIQGLNQVVTPPLGSGGRLVWLLNPPLSQQAKDFMSELERTLPIIGSQAHLLLTFSQKPDGRSKIFKLLEKHATVKQFASIPNWKTKDLRQLIHAIATDQNLQLPDDIADYLIDAVGNDTRAIQNALQKIQLYITDKTGSTNTTRLTLDHIVDLIPNSAQSSLELASAIRDGQTAQALSLLSALLLQNEPALRIVATLIRQFRTWTWIKVMENSGERDNQAIAKAADIRNPKRLYFLRKEIQHLTSEQLKQSLRLLRTLELDLKQGSDAKTAMQTIIIQISQSCHT